MLSLASDVAEHAELATLCLLDSVSFAAFTCIRQDAVLCLPGSVMLLLLMCTLKGA